MSIAVRVPGEVRGPGELATETRQVVPRFDTVDLLRGFSILGVVLLHARLWLLFGGVHVGSTLPRWLWPVVFGQGGNGVSMFFAISGFLITYVSVKRSGSLRRMRVAGFYRIRFARIAPLLLLLLAVLSTLHSAWPAMFRVKRGTLGGAVFATLTFHLNWYEVVHGYLPAPWTVLWSLSVEEMFYLFFPLVCVILLRNRGLRPVFYGLFFGLVIFGPLARQPWYTRSDIWLYQSYLGNLDNIAMGCLFAMLAVWLQRRGRAVKGWVLRAIELAGALLTMSIVVWNWPHVAFVLKLKRGLARSGTDVTALGLGVCLIMLGSVLRGARGRRWTAPIRWFGRYSYEVYLTHEFVVMAVLSLYLQVRRGPVALWIVATVLLSAAVGALLSRVFSEPLNRRLRGAPVPAELSEARAPVKPRPQLV